VPLVIYPSYFYSYGEFFVRTLATLYAMRAKGWVDGRCVLGSGVGVLGAWACVPAVVCSCTFLSTFLVS
jgi:hypothetical protein